MERRTAKTKSKKALLVLPLIAVSLAFFRPAYPADKTAPPPQQTTQNSKNPQAQNPEDEAYTYRSGGRRDPFLSLVYVAQQAQKKKSVAGQPPLEQYAVSDFILEAIVTRSGAPSYALVRLPNGKDYILNMGEKVGLNGGEVTKIGSDYVAVREVTTDFMGRRTAHTIILKLRKQEE